ncbi:enoyl-CoA hydratase/isomerase family protein [Bradyrhizobium sp. U87765 SZCCT0131]|uniref:enoyl-CoA hydratase/isomerase family protein n=1 Tax=unclassified Bradyrhizobium TaxID=2631580 RepID=UPI001BAA107B|nr:MULTISPECIES: enoyl-CoA hydratase/isomerase family protein [unclassified Bradyrhizobium]MBR1220664.1 enoyl-CoA hydratase/isomerase family protein [Bradyrhizobium sp. U87765 SZCCT0131]MBR1262882.1 enoyl-CoA hydratase/isomerase family protein [Bradyrhizobium sp. U87765 SZCCT0134]MBR1307236.1 enoyl-CoA hydratase/isomerase family protein [Bradyrhizobium sp. U87765 SZCCT0110]MBR1322877.1 enoyl-CoA hydratase/isomerase family protein [Bradyrhizobium sp. U87765 SZCCT0109]MBR1346190.1 enoyl-CoA hydr
MNDAAPVAEGELIVRREGTAGVLRLNRPKALNAITLDMVRGIDAALDSFELDPAIGLVLLEGAGERGLCAGGDIRGLYDSARVGGDLGKVFWSEEYIVNARIEAYPKPYVAYMDGIVMGGGVGLACHSSHRVVTEKTRIGMPEVSLGFFPDVGGTWLLSHAPGEVGTYLALTGQTAGGADAVAAGLADAFVTTAQWPALRAALTAAPAGASHADIHAIIARFATPTTGGPVAENRAEIDRLFAHDTVEAIVAALEVDGSEFALATLKTMREKSPRGLKVTLRLLREARTLKSLKEALVHEFRASLEVFASADFVEGVRAVIVDKDRNPSWNPSRLEDVTPQIVDAYFTPRRDELVFPD